MKKFVAIIFTLLIITSCDVDVKVETSSAGKKVEFGLVIHGGAGSVERGMYTEEQESAYKEKLKEALEVGYNILSEGGTALDAVENVIHVMEESSLFNAGVGSVLTNAETVEMDAAVMDGSTLNAGTVAGIKHIKSPITLARAVMEKSKHVMMIGEGAEAFAKELGMEPVRNEYFITDKRLKQIQHVKAEERKKQTSSLDVIPDLKFGTVGCAVLDKQGNLAAGTSTGGMTNKKWGRVGDVPIIGAGTYANNNTCALSATGHGEYFIRNVVTHSISDLMEYKNLSLQKATDEIVMKKLVEQNGSGGVIGIDKHGNITMTFNSPGMFRGYITDKNEPYVAMYRDE